MEKYFSSSLVSFTFTAFGLALFITGFLSPLWNVVNDPVFLDRFQLTTLGLWEFCLYEGGDKSCQMFNAGIFSTLVRVTECFALLWYVITVVSTAMFHGNPDASTFMVPIISETVAVLSTVLSVILWPTLHPFSYITLSWGYWCTLVSVPFASVGIFLQCWQSYCLHEGILPQSV